MLSEREKNILKIIALEYETRVHKLFETLKDLNK